MKPPPPQRYHADNGGGGDDAGVDGAYEDNGCVDGGCGHYEYLHRTHSGIIEL